MQSTRAPRPGWSLPVAAVLAAAAASFFVGSDQPLAQHSAATVVEFPFGCRLVDQAGLDRIVADQSLRASFGPAEGSEGPCCVQLKVEGPKESRAARVLEAAGRIADRLHPQPLSSDERASKLYAAETRLADLEHSAASSEEEAAEQQRLIALKQWLSDESLEGRHPEPIVGPVRETVVEPRRRLVRYAPGLLLLVLAAALCQLLAPVRAPTLSTATQAAGVLSMPAKSVNAAAQRAA